MKIVITGANSFIGRYLSQKAVEQNWETVMVMRSESSALPIPGTTVVNLSLSEYSRLGSLTRGCDCFVHLAWMGTWGNERMNPSLQKANVDFSIQAVESMITAGCGRIITAGSQAEYGVCTQKITEENVCHPNTEYGKSKLSFYESACDICGKKSVRLYEPRYFSLYGVGDSSRTMIMCTLQKMLRNEQCQLTECIQKWDYLYILDAVEGLWKLCTMDCPEGIYNFASGDIRRLRDYVEEMARITATESKLCFGAVPYPATGMISLQPDVSKIKRALHWEPKMTFSNGIKAILHAMKAEEG